MKAKSSSLLLISLTVVLIQGCELERIAPQDPQCPTVTELQPAAAHSGEIVSIKGKKFYDGMPELYKILIADKTVDVLDMPDSTTLRFKVPAGIGSGVLSVALASGLSCNTGQNTSFTYYYTGSAVSTLYNQLLSPQGLDLNNLGNLVVADSGNFQIRVIDPATGNLVSTLGKGGSVTVCDGAAIKTSEAHFFAVDIDVDVRGNIYIAEPSRNVIRWIDIRTPDSVRTYAGKCNERGFSRDTVHRLDARLTNPYSVFRDSTSNSLYFTDAIGIRKVFNSLVHVHTTLTDYTVNYRGIEINRSGKDNMGPVFVTNLGIHPGGSGSYPGSIVSLNDQGVASSLEHANLISPIALTIDSRGNIFVADYIAHRIIVIYTNGVLKILAGTGVSGDDNLPVPGLKAKFKRPTGIALAEKDGVVSFVYVSDSGNDKVKEITIE